MTMKTQLKTYQVQQKQFYEGILEQYNPTSRKEKHRIGNLTLYLKQLEKENKTPKLVEGKNS